MYLINILTITALMFWCSGREVGRQTKMPNQSMIKDFLSILYTMSCVLVYTNEVTNNFRKMLKI